MQRTITKLLHRNRNYSGVIHISGPYRSLGCHRVLLGSSLVEGVIQGGRIMTLKNRSAPRERLVTYAKNTCPQCSEWLLAPDWSEYLSECCVRHIWSCTACGYQFETSVAFPAAAAA